jgi:hypothetical protein
MVDYHKNDKPKDHLEFGHNVVHKHIYVHEDLFS